MYITGIVVVLLILIIVEVFMWVHRTYAKYELYKRAEARAREIGRPLVVIGAPHGGNTDQVFGETHGAGDYCVDLLGCRGARKRSYKGKAHEFLRGFRDDSCVVFSSMVLEYVDEEDLNETAQHFLRIAGCNENLFLVGIQEKAWTPCVYEGTHRVITKYPEGRQGDRAYTIKTEPRKLWVNIWGNADE